MRRIAVLALMLAVWARPAAAATAEPAEIAASAPAYCPPPELVPRHGAASTTFARSWTGAFITGNGTMGAMVMGAGGAMGPSRPNEDTLYFSHSGLFLPMGTREVVPQLAEDLEPFRQTNRTRGYGPALMGALARAQAQGYPGLRYGDPFVPALELKLKMPVTGAARDYLRTEDFSTGEVAVRWADDEGEYLRKLFISRADNVAVLWIAPAGPAAASRRVSCELWVPPIPNVPVRTYQMNNPSATPAESAANALIQGHAEVDAGGLTIHNVYREGKGSGYDAAARVIADGGEVQVAEGRIMVREAAGILVLLRIEPYARPAAGSERRLRAALEGIPPRYDPLLGAHVRLHEPLFNRVSLDLGGGADRAATTDTLLARANDKKAQVAPALLERLYDASRYQFICAAGRRAPNLQGLWAASWAPAASQAGDYAFNAPLQLSMASALSCNTPELMQGLFALADERLGDWQLNARNLFGARGIVVPPRQSSTGKCLQWSDRQPAGFCWTAGGAMLAHWYYDYYLHTGDRRFLAQTAVPFMKQVAAFYEDFLFIDSSGHYRFCPSYSTDNAAGDNSTVDVMVASQLLGNLIEACRALRTEQESVARWERMLALMPPYLVNISGELQEWALPAAENKTDHRHIPHLYAVYPGRQLDPERTPELWQAARNAFDARFNQWFRPVTRPGENNPQSIQDRLQMGLVAARFGDGGQVGEVLTRIAARHTYPSMMTQRHEDGRTFAADASGAVPEMLHAALLDSRPGRIDLLPALPHMLPAGEIRGLAAQHAQGAVGGGRITVDLLKWSPSAIDVQLTSSIDQTLTLRLPGNAVGAKSRQVALRAGAATRLHFDLLPPK